MNNIIREKFRRRTRTFKFYDYLVVHIILVGNLKKKNSDIRLIIIMYINNRYLVDIYKNKLTRYICFKSVNTQYYLNTCTCMYKHFPSFLI